MGELNRAADDEDEDKPDRRWAKYALLAALLLLTACLNWPAGNGTVSGRVTRNGGPVRGGTVTLQVNGVEYSGGINADGSYTVTDVPPGHALIGLTITEPPPAKPRSAAPAAKGRPRPIVIYHKAPAEFGQTLQVGRGKTSHDIKVPD